MSEQKPIVAYACGPSSNKCRCQCPDGPCEHVWDGPWIELEDDFRSMTCSRCGMPGITHSMWVGP